MKKLFLFLALGMCMSLASIAQDVDVEFNSKSAIKPVSDGYLSIEFVIPASNADGLQGLSQYVKDNPTYFILIEQKNAKQQSTGLVTLKISEKLGWGIMGKVFANMNVQTIGIKEGKETKVVDFDAFMSYFKL
jgi:hypothetical protein